MTGRSSPVPGMGGFPGGALAVVPARLSSTRLPGKMLLAQTGAALVVETARNARQTGVFRDVWVAADHPDVVAVVEAAGFVARLTDPELPSGTDRVRAALSSAQAGQFEVVVNVQGDEPELAAADLSALVAAFLDPEVEIASLWAPLDPAAAGAADIVKVVLDRRGDALYFSRSPIPALGHGSVVPAPGPTGDGLYRRHVGVYAYRPAALGRFCALAPGTLEQAERLEQLRWLESGGKIRMVRASHITRGIDTAQDYAEFVDRTRARRAPAPAPAVEPQSPRSQP